MAGDLGRQRTECPTCTCLICVSVYNMIAKCPKPPSDNYKQRKNGRFNERSNFVFNFFLKDNDNDNNKNIYAYMAHMSGNKKVQVENLAIVRN